MRIVFTMLLGLSLALAACSKQKQKPEAPEPEAATQTDDLEAEDTDTSADTDDQPVATTGEPAVQLDDVVYFEYDSALLTDTARDRLQNNARWLEKHPENDLNIAGHADERGTPEYNIALGMERARAIKEYLVRMGISAERLKTISYGEERPLVPGKHEKNRRAEFEPI